MNSTDATLLQRWRARQDADAFAELVLRHSGPLFATCRRMLGDATQAEEIAQEYFIEMMKSGAAIRTSLGAWLHTIAVRRCIDRIRSDVRRRKRESAFADTQAQAESAPDSAEVSEILTYVDEAIEELPCRLRAAVIADSLKGAPTRPWPTS